MGTKERQDRERQAVTASILNAARDLFVAEGYQNVSIRKIAERIEYSPAAIYSYFASKDDIFLALADEGFHRLDAKVRSRDEDRRPARRRARLLVGVLRVLAGAAGLLPVDVRRPIGAAHHAAVGRLRVPAADARQRRRPRSRRRSTPARFPTTLNPNAAMHMLWASLIGPAVVGIRHRLATGEDYDALARDVLNATIAGLQAGVATTFVSCKCPEEGIAGAPVPAGVRRHES